MHLLSSFVNNSNISKLEAIVKENIIIEGMIVYKYSDNGGFDIIIDENSNSIENKEAFLNYAINNEKEEFDNHINNNKPYSFELHNLDDLTITGILIYPVVTHKKRIGLLLLYKGIEHGVNFTDKDESIIKNLKPILIQTINQKMIGDRELLKYKKSSHNIFDGTKEIEQKLEIALNSKKELEKVLKDYIKKDAKSNKKYEKESQKNIELEDELKTLKNELKVIKDSFKELQNENIELKSNIKDKNTIINKYNNNEIKVKHAQKKLSYSFEEIEKNIEFALREFANKFNGYHNAYILFEIIVYALSSSKNMNIIDSFISKIRGFDDFINKFYTTTSIKANRDKYKIRNIFNNIDNIHFHKNLPISLVIDTPKINSILYHIKEDLASLENDKNLININVSYDNQMLHIQLDTKIYNNSNRFKNLFKQKISDSDKNRKGVAVSNRLIKMMKGELDMSYNNNKYQYDIFIPAKVLNLKFV
ncbi:MAG: hypothetical protein QM493_07915 [Sulfurovum sp.]